MKKGIIYSLITGFVVALTSCGVQLQTYDLSEEYAIGLHNQVEPEKKGAGAPKEEDQSEKSALIGVTARSFYGGDLKRGGIWWASKGIYIERGDTFAIEVTPLEVDSIAGATNPVIVENTHPFGATFPPIDLIKEPVMLKVIARAESKDTSSAVLYVQLVDADGFMTNAKLPFNKIENSTEFKEYFFDLRDIYNQSVPEKHKVNGALINTLQFFVNPGQTPGFNGIIYINEIRVVPAPPITK